MISSAEQMTKRITSGIAVAALVAGVTFCGGTPTAPKQQPAPTQQPAPPPIPPGLAVVSLRISGPTELAPRGKGQSLGQFTASATMSDGSTADVTATALWSTSQIGLLHPTARPGEMQAEGPGEVRVTATVGVVSATVTVLVAVPGTFSISGVVTDVSTRQGLQGVVITVPSIRRSTGTDSNGRYVVPGASGTVEITASARGFVSQTTVLDVTGVTTQDFVLAPERPPANVTGDWTLTVSASPSCRQKLPEAARDRSYDLVVTQQSARVVFQVTTPSAVSLCGSTLGTLVGTLFGDLLEFVIVGDTSYDGFSSVCFGERLGPDQSVGIGVIGTGPVLASEIRMTTQGDIEYWPNPDLRGVPSVVCRATDHSAILRRR
jgi:hypothetical protein